ncbi:alpha-amylase family glycosyl hydrolase [Falsibacillus pallidus]|uniref:alpha-amylase n=1 Tax=Falsibacillus pallidus TaxID=493781 RepID=A0A370GW77_9BACI|nr:alpha-amylase family glycosyl hydrolase [Falsibacillus pallidus]RDI47801.1 alpha-amylase [Falsibacillus pallidus]
MRKRWLPIFLIPFLLFHGYNAKAAEKEERNWQDETIYFLMVDRFNNGDASNDFNVNMNDPKAYQGGDFQGVIDKLDYLKDMGFTAIWLTPIFDNQDGGYHGYWINDFYKTDEHFGSIEKFKELVKEAHKRDMKVIVDFVANHVGPDNPWVNDPAKKDWFHEKKPIIGSGQSSLENGWIYDLPDLNQDNPEVKKYLIDAAKWWIKETDIDGYRLDTVKHVPITFWKDFAKEVKSVKKNFYLLGEVWSEDPNYIKKYQEAGIDGLVDYPLNGPLKEAFVKPDVSMERPFTMWDINKNIYPHPELMGSFLDNHDMQRYTRDMIEAKQFPGTRWQLALTYLYTTPEIPIVYYGTEIAQDGGNDPDNRRFMNFRANKDLIDYMTKIGELRQQLPALRRGDMKLLYQKDGMAVFKREYKDETVVVAINNTSKSQKVVIPEKDLKPDKELRGLQHDDLVKDKNGNYTIIIDREKSEIYALADKSGVNIKFISSLALVYIAFMIFLIAAWRRGKKNKNKNN